MYLTIYAGHLTYFAAMLPPAVPVAPANPNAGLVNWPDVPSLPTGPTIELPAPTDTLLRKAIFHQPSLPDLPSLPVNMVIERLDTASTSTPPLAEIRTIDVSASIVTTVDHIDSATAEVTATTIHVATDQPSLSAEPLPTLRDSSFDMSKPLPTPEPIPAPDADPLFAYDNKRLTLLPPSAQERFAHFVSTLMDHAVNYLLKESQTEDLTSAMQNFSFALKQMRGDASARGRSPARNWYVDKDGPQRRAEKITRMCRLLHECVSPTITPGEIVTDLDGYTYTQDDYRYCFRDLYRGDMLLVQWRTPGGWWTPGHMAWDKVSTEAAQGMARRDYQDMQERAEKNRSPLRQGRPGATERALGAIQDMNMQAARQVFAQGVVNG